MKTPLLISLSILVCSTFAHADTTYTVRAGDTLLSIADRTIGDVESKKDPRRYQLAQKIKAKNPQLKNPNNLTPGETIVIPGIAATTKAAPEPSKPVPTVKAPVIPPPAPLPEPEHSAPAEVAATEPAIPILKPATEQPKVESPTPAEAPAAVETRGEKHEENFDYLALQPRYHFTHIKFTDLATGQKNKVDSKTSAGLDLQYAKAIGERARFLVNVGYTSTQYKPFDSNALTLEHVNEKQWSYGLGIAYELTSALHLDVMAKMADHTFVLPVDATTYEMHGIALPGGEISLSWDFVNANSYLVGASVIGEYISGTTKNGITYKSAFDTIGMLYVASKRGSDKMNYRLSATYDKRDQNTNVTEQAEESWIAGLTLYFPL